jgi:hypothetical protein
MKKTILQLLKEENKLLKKRKQKLEKELWLAYKRINNT